MTELVIYVEYGLWQSVRRDHGAQKWLKSGWTNWWRWTSVSSLADTIGVADPESIAYLFGHLIPEFPDVEFGAHLHTTPDAWLEKIDAAWKHGCRRFDGAIKGFGGCPSQDDLTGNMAAENIIQYFNHERWTRPGKTEFRSVRMALKVFQCD